MQINCVNVADMFSGSLFTWYAIIVAFSIVAGLPIVAKFGHNQLCTYMALLISGLEHCAQRSKTAKNLRWISAPHRPSRNTSRQHCGVLEK